LTDYSGPCPSPSQFAANADQRGRIDGHLLQLVLRRHAAVLRVPASIHFIKCPLPCFCQGGSLDTLVSPLSQWTPPENGSDPLFLLSLLFSYHVSCYLSCLEGYLIFLLWIIQVPELSLFAYQIELSDKTINVTKKPLGSFLLFKDDALANSICYARDFIWYPRLQWVTVWIPDQKGFGNDNLRIHQGWVVGTVQVWMAVIDVSILTCRVFLMVAKMADRFSMVGFPEAESIL